MFNIGDKVEYIGKTDPNGLQYGCAYQVTNIGNVLISVEVAGRDIAGATTDFRLILKNMGQNNPIIEIDDLVVYMGVATNNGNGIPCKGVCYKVYNIYSDSKGQRIINGKIGMDAIQDLESEFRLVSKAKNSTIISSVPGSLTIKLPIGVSIDDLNIEVSGASSECECGAHKVGSNRHSQWCKLWVFMN